MRWRSSAALVLAILLVSILVSGCASLDRPRAQGQTVALPTPERSFDPATADTVARLEAALEAVGHRLEVPPGAYRPSEPPSLLQIPRAVLRADLAAPDEGFLVVYRAADAATARMLAADLAAYLGTGLGRTNYPADTRFSIAVDGSSLVFSSWSPSRSADPARGEDVFEAIASVGQPVDVAR
jgi:hypothetical protein